MLHFCTPYGDHYKVNSKGQIISCRGIDHKPHDDWKFLGMEHVKKSMFVPFSNITPELLKNIDILYKNGRPQWTVRDFDHGTTRIWGNTHWHGIKRIWFEED